MPDDRTQTTAALNPFQIELDLDLLLTKAKKEAQKGRLISAQKQQSELTRKQLKELNGGEVQLDDLERNVQILDGKYRMHVDKLEQARVNDALGRDGISNVKVAQAATLVTKPSAPKKPLLLMLGLVLASRRSTHSASCSLSYLMNHCARPNKSRVSSDYLSCWLSHFKADRDDPPQRPSDFLVTR